MAAVHPTDAPGFADATEAEPDADTGLAAVPSPDTADLAADDAATATAAAPADHQASPGSTEGTAAKGRRFNKPSLVALAHGIEASLVSTEPDPDDLPVVIALFQRPEYFASERRRYREIARHSMCTFVGFVDEDPDVPSPINGIPIAANDALAREFALIIISKCICVSVVGEDLGDGTGSEAERNRVFEARWSFDRPTAIAEARRLLASFGDSVPATLQPQIEQRLADAEKAVPRRIEARLTASFEQMVDKYERLAVRLQTLTEQSHRHASAASSTTTNADRDPLTGALNQSGFARYLGNRILSQPDTTRVAIAWIDIDDLDQINGAYGRDAGDAAIKAVYSTLSDLLREDDGVARFDNDEFIVAMPGMEIGAAKRRAEEFVEEVGAMSLAAPHDTVNLTISCAVAIGDLATLALERLRDTLYRTRGTARGRTVVGDYLTSE